MWCVRLWTRSGTLPGGGLSQNGNSNNDTWQTRFHRLAGVAPGSECLAMYACSTKTARYPHAVRPLAVRRIRRGHRMMRLPKEVHVCGATRQRTDLEDPAARVKRAIARVVHWFPERRPNAPMSEAVELSRSQIQQWPKAELHCHLDGSLRLETMLDLARAQGKMAILPSDSREGLEAILHQVDASETLESYLEWFRYTIPLMQTRGALARIAYDLAEDCAMENVRYLEVRYGPVLHTEEGLSLEEVNDAVLDGLRRAEDDLDIRANLIICGLRDRYESASLRQAELAAAYRGRGVVGFDLAGGEAGHPPKHHLSAFYFARNHLLNLTVHAGESWGADSIKQAVFFCGAHRIGHGTTLYQDADLMQYFADHQIPLEICPTSNLQTHVVTSLDSHPLRQYVEAGVPITINTDNRLFSRTTVTDELYRTHAEACIPAETLREIVLNGFRHAFLPWDEKQELIRSVTPTLPSRSNQTPAW